MVRFDPAKMAAPRGEYESPAGAKPLGRSAIDDVLARECKQAKRDDRIVERLAMIELIEDERVYLTNTGGELRQRFRFTVPHMRVAANQGRDTQVRSLDHAQQGGFELVERGGFIGSGGRLAEEAIQLLTAPNCPVAGEMPGNVKAALELVDGIGEVTVNMTFDPPWTPDRMSEEAKLELNMF